MITLKHVGFDYEIHFSYSPYLVAEVKSLGARYNPTGKFWTVPESSQPELMEWAAKHGYTNEVIEEIAIPEVEPLPELTIDIPLKLTPFAYQKNGIAYGLKKKRFIMGDEPGLGKTGQAIAIAEGSGCKCILIICPATLKQNWKVEIEDKWTERKALILNERVKNSWVQFYRVGMIKYVIVNYESLKKFFVSAIVKPADVPLRLNHIKFNDTINTFDCVIIDESHRCKDGKTQQSKFVMGICKGKEYIMALTGTPVVNKPMDLIPQLHIIGQLDAFGKYTGFINRYCAGSNRASNLRELNYQLNNNCFFRRLKKDVLKDLPDKMRSLSPVEITNQKDYKKAEDHFIEYLRENLKKSEGEITKSLRGEVMVQLGILKKIAALGKLEDVISHISDVVDAGEKIVVFAWHRDIVQTLKQAIPGAVTIVGDNTLDERQRAVNSFQNDPKTLVMLCNIKSGGVGITLTASSRVAFIELPWHPADCDQCEDRCHRIGQKDSVQCTYFIGSNTVDEYIYDIISKKRLIVNQVMGLAEVSEEQKEQSMVDEIINRYSEKL